MSELKAINAYKLTTNTEDSDVYIHNDEFGCGGDLVECYLKSEADKVIAELKDIDSKNRSAYYKDLAMMAKDVEHQKYKRCLAMARWCEATALWCYQAANTLPVGFHATLYGKPVMIEPDRLFRRHVLLTKWSTRWRELAERFKPNKEADDGND